MHVTGFIDGLEVTVGGLSRSELLGQLASDGILLNVHAETLLGSGVFDGQPPRVIALVVRSVADLGLAEGATLSTIFSIAQQQGLALSPADTGPNLRLVVDHQVDAPDAFLTTGRAPTGSLTVASAPLEEDHEYPKGFYLRVITGQKWLRGYRCDQEHVWSGEDRFVFRQPLGEVRTSPRFSAPLRMRSSHPRRRRSIRGPATRTPRLASPVGRRCP